jgi:ribosomal protein L37AE/L43A
VINIIIISIDTTMGCTGLYGIIAIQYKEKDKRKIGSIKICNQEEYQCAICIDDIKARDTIIQLRCDGKHVFHEACILDWVKVRLICPTCRGAIDI